MSCFTRELLNASLIIPIMIALLVSCGPSMTKREQKKIFFIDPIKGVGPITPNCTEKDLLDFYGPKNLRRSDIDVGESETVVGTTLFSNSPNALLIEWKDSFKIPERLTISSPGTQWKTIKGITIGTTLEQIEKFNGGPFKLTGFGWDYEGRTMSWENGNLPKQLQLDLVPTQEVTAEEDDSVQGDRNFRSDHPVMKKKKLAVKTVFIRWD
jgi:hypothetical protein